MSFLFKNHSHAKVIYLSIRWYKVGFSNNTGVRKQNTHTHTHTHTHAPNTQRKITPGKVSWYENK